jgi:hypothetical protein
MKLRILLASCVIALAACASTGQNGPLATEANVISSVQVAAELGQALYDAGKMSDEEAAVAIAAFRAARQNFDAYRAAIAAGNTAGAAAYLRLAADGLDALMAQLNAIKKKG